MEFFLGLIGILIITGLPLWAIIAFVMTVLDSPRLRRFRNSTHLHHYSYSEKTHAAPTAALVGLFSGSFMSYAPLNPTVSYEVFETRGFGLGATDDPFRGLRLDIGLSDYIFAIHLNYVYDSLTCERTLYLRVKRKGELGSFRTDIDFSWYKNGKQEALAEYELPLVEFIIDGVKAEALGLPRPGKGMYQRGTGIQGAAAPKIGMVSPKTNPPPAESGAARAMPSPELKKRNWPTPQDFAEAVQNPDKTISDPDLKYSSPKLNVLGLPQVASGMFASVFEMQAAGKTWAVRCFNSEPGDKHERYREISKFILSDKLPYTVDFAYLDNAINIDGAEFPILKMDWVEGLNLDSYLANNLNNKEALEKLRNEFHLMMKHFADSGIAHGDLQHGNILIKDDKIFLVDYDGFYVPALQGKQSGELGHPNYQHPGRNKLDFGPYLDNFSAWLIDLSLVCLIEDPKLWHEFNGGDECLLFRKIDLLAAEKSPVFSALLKHKSGLIRSSASLVLEFLKLKPENVPPLCALGIEAEIQDMAVRKELA